MVTFNIPVDPISHFAKRCYLEIYFFFFIWLIFGLFVLFCLCFSGDILLIVVVVAVVIIITLGLFGKFEHSRSTSVTSALLSS